MRYDPLAETIAPAAEADACALRLALYQTPQARIVERLLHAREAGAPGDATAFAISILSVENSDLRWIEFLRRGDSSDASLRLAIAEEYGTHGGSAVRGMYVEWRGGTSPRLDYRFAGQPHSLSGHALLTVARETLEISAASNVKAKRTAGKKRVMHNTTSTPSAAPVAVAPATTASALHTAPAAPVAPATTASVLAAKIRAVPASMFAYLLGQTATAADAEAAREDFARWAERTAAAQTDWRAAWAVYWNPAASGTPASTGTANEVAKISREIPVCAVSPCEQPTPAAGAWRDLQSLFA